MNLACLNYKSAFQPNMEADWFIGVSIYHDINGMCFHVCICVNPHVPVCNVQLVFPETQNTIAGKNENTCTNGLSNYSLKSS